MTCTVVLFRDYLEDNRQSMEVYPDGLGRALRSSFPERYQVREYRPRLFRPLTSGVWQMRFARYALYPWQARRHQGHLNHIVDHGYGHLLYFLDPKRTVVTVHDLIPVVRWRNGISGLSPGRKPWLNLLSFNALRRAAHLFAVSDNTRHDLIRYCGCAPERISVIYSGVDTIFRKYSVAEKLHARQALGLVEDAAYHVLIMGSQAYKNQLGALRAINELRKMVQRPLRLLKTGLPNPEWTEGVRQLALEEVSKCLGLIPRERLPDLYNSVDCLLFPSLYEGFGWPPLEAMACGTPVVASNAASLPEVIGDAGVMCAPQDYRGLAEALRTTLTNQNLRHSLIVRGLAWAKQFTWERTARQTLDVYEKVAQSSLEAGKVRS